MSAWNGSSAPRVADVVAFAITAFGRKPGIARAAEALGIAERTARGIAYGEATGATVPAHLVDAALHTLRRARAAQLRAELAALEEPHANQDLEMFRAPVLAGR
jgi:hypothetical protein